ncbi:MULTISPECIES: hypothetical protein [Candidatus Ichthyocystis]|uniref:hypothetical protein n=1 Tax=Candidatus Ichthyocystis TaxID=2929841 RepID=UPI000B892757|nr:MULTISPECIES: hypothetical protein [Ichthyocystis]
MEDNFLCAVEEKAAKFFRSWIKESSLLSGTFVIADISRLRGGLFSDTEVGMSDFLGSTLRKLIVELLLLIISLVERLRNLLLRKPVGLGYRFLPL